MPPQFFMHNISFNTILFDVVVSVLIISKLWEKTGNLDELPKRLKGFKNAYISEKERPLIFSAVQHCKSKLKKNRRDGFLHLYLFNFQLT